MKLWQKGAAAHEKVDHFTVGKDREYDLVLAQYDCQASKCVDFSFSRAGSLIKTYLRTLKLLLNIFFYRMSIFFVCSSLFWLYSLTI